MSEAEFLQTEKKHHMPTPCILRIKNVWTLMLQQKQSWKHVFSHISVTSVQPTCSLRHTNTCSEKHREEEGGGAFWQADQGQHGLFAPWCEPTGHWALTAYATAPTYREINPHFIPHICSIAPKKTAGDQTAAVWVSWFQKDNTETMLTNYFLWKVQRHAQARCCWIIFGQP